MDKLMSIGTQIERTKIFLTPFLPFANSHMVGFFKENHWNNLLPPGILDEVNKNGIDSAIETFWQTKDNLMQHSKNNIFTSTTSGVTNTKVKNSDNFEELKMNFPNLVNFIENANRHALSQSSFCMTDDQLKNKLDINAEDLKLAAIQEFMSNKKSHEVEKMSHILGLLHKWSGSTHIIDVGGGKGYLSIILSKFYNIPVLNIDRSLINEEGALKLNTNLDKKWKSILNQIENSGNEATKRSRRKRYRQRACNDDLNIENTDCNDMKECLYKHVTKFITPDTDILKILENHFPCEGEEKNICFTGLHTCGSLGSAILKLFIECSSASLLCVVPCCYNLLQEEIQCYELSNFPENTEIVEYDFPMSLYLKGYSVGQNARMLAVQALDRTVNTRQLPKQSLYYRALLEILLGDFPAKRDSRSKLKRVNDEEDFYEYVNIALKRLNLENEYKFSRSELEDFEALYSCQRKNLHLYYLLRMCLSPVLESLLLLDKLMFLIENGFDGRHGDAFLVRLFDSVLSPRCMAIVAYRHNKVNKINSS